MTCATAARHDRLDQGFSLIEVLVVASLLVGVVTGVAQVFVIAARAASDAEHATYATVLAAQKMEELRAAPLDAVPASVDYTDARGSLVIEGAGSPRASYERRWSVGPLAPATDLFVITVAVAHRHTPAPAGRARLVTFRTVRQPTAGVEEPASGE